MNPILSEHVKMSSSTYLLIQWTSQKGYLSLEIRLCMDFVRALLLNLSASCPNGNQTKITSFHLCILVNLKWKPPHPNFNFSTPIPTIIGWIFFLWNVKWKWYRPCNAFHVFWTNLDLNSESCRSLITDELLHITANKASVTLVTKS